MGNKDEKADKREWDDLSIDEKLKRLHDGLTAANGKINWLIDHVKATEAAAGDIPGFKNFRDSATSEIGDLREDVDALKAALEKKKEKKKKKK